MKIVSSWFILSVLWAGISGPGPWTSKEQEMRPVHRIADFIDNEEELRWRVVNDGVMGGLSQSKFYLTPEGTAIFQGLVSLENNGGFASVRSLPREHALGSHSGLRLRVRGDGKVYRMRLRTNDRWDGVVYDAPFQTTKDSWTEVELTFEKFIPRFRGRRVDGAPALDPAKIQQIGFLISDKQEGRFRLEVDWIQAGASPETR